MISRAVWTAYSDGTLTPELMAVNPESHCRTSKVATISHGPSVRHSHALSQVRTWLSWFVICLIAVQQNDDPGPWVFINSIARPIIGLAQALGSVGLSSA